jgi:GNAT superfamily N-acetyltransferase
MFTGDSGLEMTGSSRAYSVGAMSAVGRPRRGRAAGPTDDVNLTESDTLSCDHRRVTTPSRSAATDITIVPLTPARLDDLATLFEQGGDPKWCWCSYFRVRGRSWANATSEQNRTLLGGLADRAPAPGLVAYRAGQAVGWVSLGPREDYERLAYSTVLAPIDDRPVWSIVCFVVGRRERGKGVAGALLDASVEHARANGATTLEAYPADTGGARISSASAYHGTLSMFERAGFAVVARRQFNKASPVRPIVRLEL